MPTFRESALHNGHIVSVVPIERINDLRAEIDEFASTQELNGFQQWIVSQYVYEMTENEFEAKSVVCVVLPRPSYGEVIFEYAGRSYKLYAVDTPFSHAGEDYVKRVLKDSGYSFSEAPLFFPRKRFAVQTGLAEYGRNNVTYVTGYGSYVDYAVYFSDMPADEDTWRGVIKAKRCETCGACQKSCPTRAIVEDRFLLDNARCLSAFNEGADEQFPDFVPKDAHHSLFDCMRCQIICPMNADYNKNTYPTICFTEAETMRLMQGAPYDDLDSDLCEKYDLLDLKYTANLPRNLRACFDLIDSGKECSLS